LVCRAYPRCPHGKGAAQRTLMTKLMERDGEIPGVSLDQDQDQAANRLEE